MNLIRKRLSDKEAKKLNLTIKPKNLSGGNHKYTLNEIQCNLLREIRLNKNVLIYDIETSLLKADVWWSGKQYIHSSQISSEPRIITVAWKWLGSDKVKHLKWDENHCDEKLVKRFLKVYNKADIIIGQNNDKFDNRWINARAIKFNFDVNLYVKSLDIMKQAKRIMRIPGYSMAFMTEYLGVTNKQTHEGLIMWKKIQYGNESEQKEYLQKMIDYNVGDIISTEDMYLRLRKYMKFNFHLGTLNKHEKYTCPSCGGNDIELYKTVTTGAGTIQRIMRCKHDGIQFKLNNRNYINFITS